MRINSKNVEASVLEQEPFIFLGDNAMIHNTNVRYVYDLEKEYTSKIDFRSADPEDRAELRRLANRQIRRNIRQALKSNLKDFLD